MKKKAKNSETDKNVVTDRTNGTGKSLKTDQNEEQKEEAMSDNDARMEKIHKIYMKEALRQAKKAAAIGEVPIGCVIVYQGKIIARGYNKRNSQKTTLGHAELLAIQKASRKLGDWRLEGCTMYITLEPCPMCAGAIVQARIPHVVIGAMNPKAGCAGSILNLLQMDRFNHQVEITNHICREECQTVLKDFFSQLRMNRKSNTKTMQSLMGN